MYLIQGRRKDKITGILLLLSLKPIRNSSKSSENMQESTYVVNNFSNLNIQINDLLENFL